jgi:putative DNA methylase
MTKRLIEEWLPIAELGLESVRERTPMTPFPAPNRLHVWWARRPLVASRAAVLASLLPADADRETFLHMLGIHGDPVAAKKRIAKATREGVRLGADAYGYSRAFSHSPTEKEQFWLAEEAQKLGIQQPTVLTQRLEVERSPLRRFGWAAPPTPTTSTLWPCWWRRQPSNGQPSLGLLWSMK